MNKVIDYVSANILWLWLPIAISILIPFVIYAGLETQDQQKQDQLSYDNAKNDCGKLKQWLLDNWDNRHYLEGKDRFMVIMKC